jgi:hypothetical protein
MNYQVLELKPRFARKVPRNPMGTIVESVSLHYTDGGRSDKVYNIELEEVAPNQFNVTGYNGKRGGNLTPRKQNEAPVSFAEAKILFDSLEQEKRNHRKTPYVVTSRNGSSTPATPPFSGSSTRTTFEATGYVANHPKKVSEEEALRLLDNNDYFLEQKCDGVFMSVLFQQDRVTASHKSGNGVPVPIEIETAIRQLAILAGCEVSLGLAGEYLDSTLHVFTVWEKNGTSLLSLPQHLRIALKDRLELILAEHLTSSDACPLKFVGTAKTKADKIALYENVKAGSGEGVVFKHRESDISFKYKLYETTEVLLVANSQRSAECFAYHEGTLISLGSATLPNNSIHQEIKEANLRQEPIVGSVKYLYLSAPPVIGPGCGQLTQASFLRFRPEFAEHCCITTELKIVNKTVLSLTTDDPVSIETPTSSTTAPEAFDQLLFPMLSTSS